LADTVSIIQTIFMQIITSREHALFKQLMKLIRSTQQRKREKLTVLDGIHLVQTYYQVYGSPFKLLISESACQQPEIASFLKQLNQSLEHNCSLVMSDALFKQISPVVNPSGIMALITIPAANHTHPMKFCVLLDAIQDPGNLGSILRSAASANVNAIYLSKTCADAWSPKTLRAAMGAHFFMAIHENADLVQIAQHFHGMLFATSSYSEHSLFQTKLTEPIAFVFGNEGSGVSRELMDCVSEILAIPMNKNCESLNVAAAAAICLFEKLRQQLK